MRLRDAHFEIPGMAVVTRVLVCDACGRAALPEDVASIPQVENAPAE